MKTKDFFGAGVVAFELKGCHLFLVCENGQRTDVNLCEAKVNSCGPVADNKFEILANGTSYVFDESEEHNPSGLTQVAMEGMVGECSCGGGDAATAEALAEVVALLEAIINQQALGAASLEQVGCVTEGEGKFAPVTAIVLAKENEDGSISFVSIGTDGTIIDPYEGPITLKTGGSQLVFKQLWVADPESEYCHQPIYMCLAGGIPDGEQYVCTGGRIEELPVGILTTPYQPSGDKICAEAQAGPIELLTGETTVGDIVAANLPAGFDFNGTVVPVTADDVSSITIIPKACGTLDSAGTEVTIDYVNIDGIAASMHVDDEEGGVNAATAVEVPAGGCSVVSLCFKSCLSKQELAGLTKREG